MKDLTQAQQDSLQGGLTAECSTAIGSAVQWASLGPIGGVVGIYLVVTSC